MNWDGLIMRVCRRCQYDLSLLEDTSICPECGCKQREYIRPMFNEREKLFFWLFGVSFVLCTVVVVLGAARVRSSPQSALMFPMWFQNGCFVGSYVSVIVPAFIFGRASNRLASIWRPIVTTLLCALPIFLLWLFVITLLISLLS